jgi:hypothetical protein
VTTWPVLTEALYLLGPDAAAQDRLLGKVESGDIVLTPLDAEDVPEIRSLMKKYRDLPMDLGDASLVHVGCRERIQSVFTLDGDFAVYRMDGGRRFDVQP